MKLRAWLDEHGMTAGDFAGRVGVSVHAVNAWCQGARRPSRSKMPLVVRETGGAVQPNDFFEMDAPPGSLASILAQLGGHEAVAAGAGIAVTVLEDMERDGRLWTQYERQLADFAGRRGYILDVESLTLRAFPEHPGAAA